MTVDRNGKVHDRLGRFASRPGGPGAAMHAGRNKQLTRQMNDRVRDQARAQRGQGLLDQASAGGYEDAPYDYFDDPDTGQSVWRQGVRENYVHTGRDKDGYYRDQKSVQDVEDWLLTEYPYLKEVNLSTLSLDKANRIANETDLFGQRFPEVMDDWLRGIMPLERKHGASSGAVAGASQGSGYLYFKASKLNDALCEDQARMGWWHSGATSIEAVWTHELGHILDFYMTDYQYADPAYRGQHDAFKDRWGTQHVSGYAKTNTKETWAEGFSAIFHQDPAEYHTYTEAQWRYLEEYWGAQIWDI